MCEKQTSVSHSSTEAELISLGAGLRMDGIPALTLWGLMEVYHSVPNRTDGPKTKREPRGTRRQLSSQTCITPPNTTHSDPSAMLYVFEDNEAVIEMVIKDRVALDRLFDRINVDPKIQIRYMDTKHQLADMLTQGNFRRDEWNNLLHLFNISHFSSTCCTKNFSLITCSTMAKRIQDQTEQERVLSKSRPAVMNLSSFIATSSSAASSPIASESPGMPIASGKPDSRMRINPNSFDAASTSQVRLKDAYFVWLMEKRQGNPSHQEEEHSEHSGNPEAEIWYYNEELVGQNSKTWEQPLAHGASSSVDKESQKDTEATWIHYFQVSPHIPLYGSQKSREDNLAIL